MKTAVMYGAGKIGRGFMGQVFSDSGYEVCFIDNRREITDALNVRGAYPIRFVTGARAEDRLIAPVRAVPAGTARAAEEIAACEVMATAVGVNNLPAAAAAIARGIALRAARGGGPLNVIICENQLEVHRVMDGLVRAHLTEAERAWADGNLGLVEPSIGRMVPAPTPELLAEDPLLLRTEPYDELPAAASGFKGGIPALKGLVVREPFDYYIRRKLFIVNAAHAVCAYHGWRKGYMYIRDAIADADILSEVVSAAEASARALGAAYGPEFLKDARHAAAELPERFANRALMDTVTRVGADPARKLRRNDRLIGAALFAQAHGIDPAPLVRAAAAALRFAPPGDPTAPRVQALLADRGIDAVLTDVMGLRPDEPVAAAVRGAWSRMNAGA